MGKLTKVKGILLKIGMPKQQQSDLCGLIILSMAGLKEKSSWSSATNDWVRIHDIILFVNTHFGKTYAENSRETFRKQALHHFRISAIVEDNGVATNSPNYRWRITPEFLSVIKSGGNAKAINCFLSSHKTLISIYASKKKVKKIPLSINNQSFSFSPGKHNELQKAILEEFLTRFAPDSKCLYLGDTTKRDLINDVDTLHKIGFDITLHDKMPDIVLFNEQKDWLFFIEAVTSVGPISPKRLNELNDMTLNVNAGKIFVTAFPDFTTYKKFSQDIAWETEVWIAQMPDHLIHLNGDKFLGPR